MLVTIASFLEPTDAHLLRGRLEAEGIPSVVAFDGHVNTNWALALALGGVAVQVPESEREFALEIARAHAAGEYRLDEGASRATIAEEAPPPVRCGHCGSPDVERRVPTSQKVLAVALFLFGGALFPTGTAYVCGHCYNQWPVVD